MKTAAMRDGTPRVVAGDFNIRHPSCQNWVQPTSIKQLSKDWVDWAEDYGFSCLLSRKSPLSNEVILSLTWYLREKIWTLLALPEAQGWNHDANLIFAKVVSTLKMRIGISFRN
jgi:hypothetical protein